jgi:hypothetical protein
MRRADLWHPSAALALIRHAFTQSLRGTRRVAVPPIMPAAGGPRISKSP